jgi:hypothetical protein
MSVELPIFHIRVQDSQSTLVGGRTAHPSAKMKLSARKRKTAAAKETEKPTIKMECAICQNIETTTTNYFSVAEQTYQFTSLKVVPTADCSVFFTGCACSDHSELRTGVCSSCVARSTRTSRKFEDVKCSECQKSCFAPFSPEFITHVLLMHPAATTTTEQTEQAINATPTSEIEAWIEAVDLAVGKKTRGEEEGEEQEEEEKEGEAVLEKEAVLSELDTAIVQYVTHHHRVREANCIEECHCTAHWANPIKMVRTAVFYLKADNKIRVRGPDGKFQSYEHDTLCYHCLEPCEPGKACACVKSAHRINPYYRDFSGNREPKLTRNCHIDAEMVKVFFKQLSELPHDGCFCPCGQSLHRALDCHEMTCSCGFHICYYCGYARFVDSPHIGISDHFENCCQYPSDARLWYMGKHTGLTHPCTSGGPKACHGMKTDCTRPTHRHWRDMYNANRKAAWAAGFYRHFGGLSKTVEEELRKYPALTDYISI